MRFPIEFFVLPALAAQGLVPARIDSKPVGDTVPVFDAARRLVVALERYGSVWEWDGRRWFRRSTLAMPLASNDAAVYDPVRRRVLSLGSFPRVWDGARWLPEPSLGMQAGWQPAFDVARDRLQVYLNGTLREWDGSVWTTPAATAPPYRAQAALVHDPAGQRTVLFGNDGVLTADCWSWDGVVWTQVAANAPTGARGLVSMAYDPLQQRIVVYGGDGVSTSTWTLRGSLWTQLATTANPGWRVRARMVWDGTGMLLWGGNEYLAGQVWRLENDDWRLLHDEPPPMSAVAAAVAPDEINQEFVLFGGSLASYGSLPIADTWTFGQAWQRRAPATSPPPRYAAHMAWSANDTGVLLFGGYDQHGPLGDTWLWRNGTWTAQIVPQAQAPSPRSRAAIAPAPTGGVLLYGDGLGVFDHWEWNAGAWMQSSAPAPQLLGAAATFDRLRWQTFVFGRHAVTQVAEAWAWDGAQWNALPTPPPLLGLPAPTVLVVERLDAGRIVVHERGLVEWDGVRWHGPYSFASGGPPYLRGVSAPWYPGALAVTLLPGTAWSGAGMVHVLTEHPALAVPYGIGCAAVAPPELALRGPLGPEHPSAELLAVTASPRSPMGIGFGFAPASIALGNGCALLLGAPVGSVFAVTDGRGDVRLPMAVPPHPSFLGVRTFAQAAVLDSGNGGWAGVQLSSGLEIVLGR